MSLHGSAAATSQRLVGDFALVGERRQRARRDRRATHARRRRSAPTRPAPSFAGGLPHDPLAYAVRARRRVERGCTRGRRAALLSGCGDVAGHPGCALSSAPDAYAARAERSAAVRDPRARAAGCSGGAALRARSRSRPATPRACHRPDGGRAHPRAGSTASRDLAAVGRSALSACSARAPQRSGRASSSELLAAARAATARWSVTARATAARRSPSMWPTASQEGSDVLVAGSSRSWRDARAGPAQRAQARRSSRDGSTGVEAVTLEPDARRSS